MEVCRNCNRLRALNARLGVRYHNLKARVAQSEQETESLLRETYRLRAERDLYDAIQKMAYGVSFGKLLILSDPPVPEYQVTLPQVFVIYEKEAISHARKSLEAVALQAGMEKSEVENLLLGFSEAATNALIHGSGGTAQFFQTDRLVAFMVSDRGKGIPVSEIPYRMFNPFGSGGNSLGAGLTVLRESINGPQQFYTREGLGTTWLCDQWLSRQLADQWQERVIQGFISL